MKGDGSDDQEIGTFMFKFKMRPCLQHGGGVVRGGWGGIGIGIVRGDTPAEGEDFDDVLKVEMEV